jgi:hypothetical protein
MKIKFTGNSPIQSKAGMFVPGQEYDIEDKFFNEEIMEKIGVEKIVDELVSEEKQTIKNVKQDSNKLDKAKKTIKKVLSKKSK